jgi:hypothetical protein
VYFPTLMTGGDGYFNVKGVPLLWIFDKANVSGQPS